MSGPKPRQAVGGKKSRTLATRGDTRKRGIHTPVNSGPLAPPGGTTVTAPPNDSGPGGG